VLQTLSFALSVAYENETDSGEREAILRLIDSLFKSTPPSAVAEYCASIAIYHVNYFGDRATPGSLGLMGDMANHILIERKGRFSVGSEQRIENFNIIGTYGRALHRNGALLSRNMFEPGRKAVLQYAIDALDRTKKARDFDHYKYIAENIGLLGVLIEPEGVLDVITCLLEDVGALHNLDQRVDFPFSAEQRDEVEGVLLQSLANIRVLYKQQIDRYIQEILEDPKIYSAVTLQVKPEFNLATFYSWTVEHLMFRLLTRYYEPLGREALEAIRRGCAEKTPVACMTAALRHMIARLPDFVGPDAA
jgi:hypothetical protein